MIANKVLFIAHRIPYPPDKGDKIRSYHMLRHLADDHHVTVACMIDDLEDLAHVEALNDMVDNLFYEVRTPFAMKLKALGAVFSGAPFSKSCFYSIKLQEKIDQYLDVNNVQAVICFCSSSAEYVFRSRHYPNKLADKILLADLVDVDSEKWRQYAERKAGPMKWLYQREADLLHPYEQNVVSNFDRTFLVSEEEKDALSLNDEGDSVEALSNGVDLDYFDAGCCPADQENATDNRLVFSGAMDYWPNVEGATWFANQVFPEVKRAFPDAEFCIAGRNPTEAINDLRKRPGIKVTGTVPDIRDYLMSAAVCVVPLRGQRPASRRTTRKTLLSSMIIQKCLKPSSISWEIQSSESV